MPDSTGGGPATPAPSEPLGGGVVCFGDCLTNQLMARAGHVWRREKARLALLAGEHALPPAPEPSVRPARPSADAIGLAGEAAQLSARAAARAAATVDWARLTPSVARNALLLTWAVRGGCGEERAPVPSATADDADDADERADDAPPDGGDGDAAGGREVHFGRIYGDGDVPAQLLRARVWTAAHPAEPRVCVRRALLRGLDGGRRHAYKLPLESGGRPPRFGPLVVFRAPAWGAARVSLVALGPAAGAAEAAAVAAEAAGQRASAVLQPCAVRADAAIVAAAAAADTASERARLPAVERAKRWARWARALGALPGRVPMVSAPTPSADARDLAARPPRLASARPARAQDTRGFAEGAATSECGELYRLFSPMPGFASGSRLGRFGAPRAAGGAGEAACARAAASSRDWFVAELGPVRVVSVSASRALHGGAEQATWLRLKLARLAALARAERPWTILLAGARLPPPPRANGSDEAEAASEALGQLVAAHAHHFHLALTAGSQGCARPARAAVGSEPRAADAARPADGRSPCAPHTLAHSTDPPVACALSGGPRTQVRADTLDCRQRTRAPRAQPRRHGAVRAPAAARAAAAGRRGRRGQRAATRRWCLPAHRRECQHARCAVGVRRHGQRARRARPQAAATRPSGDDARERRCG
jgi:hypothetical protein